MLGWLVRLRSGSGASRLVRDLAMANERLQLTQEATGMTTWEWDVKSDEMIWTAGKTNLKVLGRADRQKFAEVTAAVYPEDRDRVVRAANSAAATMGEYYQEFRVLLPTGATRWIQSRGKMFRDPADGRIYMLGVNRDVTEWKQAEADLRASEERFRATFEQAPVGIAHLSIDGRFLLVNQKMCDMFGYSAAEFVQKAMIEVISPDDRRTAIDGRRQLLAGDIQTYRTERRYQRKDGSRFIGEASISMTRQVDGADYVIAIIHDVSMMKNALEAANAATVAKSMFLANMSHEIRTPLAAIIGFAELLGDPSYPEVSKDVCVEKILRNGRALGQLLADILDLSKIESNQIILETLPVRVPELVNEVCANFAGQARGKHVNLHAVVKPDVPAVVLTDPTRLRQILMNVVGNAVKFTHAGDVTVTVTAAAVSDGQVVVTFTTRDSGIGITAEQRGALFRPFSQADASMTRKYGGTGLGLALSRHLARHLGGDLVLGDSTPADGSTFVLTVLADVQGGVSEPVAATASRPSIAGARVLVVENAEDLRAYLEHVLTQAGAAVQVTDQGAEAIVLARAHHFDVVLLDLQMPIMDGFSVVQELRRGGYRQPVVALTAHALASERERCLASGFDEHVSKPITPGEVVRLVASYLHRAPAPS